MATHISVLPLTELAETLQPDDRDFCKAYWRGADVCVPPHLLDHYDGVHMPSEYLAALLRVVPTVRDDLPYESAVHMICRFPYGDQLTNAARVECQSNLDVPLETKLSYVADIPPQIAYGTYQGTPALAHLLPPIAEYHHGRCHIIRGVEQCFDAFMHYSTPTGIALYHVNRAFPGVVQPLTLVSVGTGREFGYPAHLPRREREARDFQRVGIW